MDQLLEKIVMVIGLAIFSHMFVSFLVFWIAPSRGFIKHFRDIRFKTTNAKGTANTLAEVPKIQFQPEHKKDEMIENAKLNMLERIGIPTLKILVGLSSALILAGILLCLEPIVEIVNEYAGPERVYPVSDIGYFFIWAGMIIYVGFFILFTKLDITGMLCEYHERYKDKNPVGLLLKMF